jgi:hypothetical protein
MDIPPIPEAQLLTGDFDTKNKDILKYIERQISQLGFDALTQVCHIIKTNDERYTAKKDVILINLGSLKQETIKELIKFILFISKNETMLDHDEQMKQKMKQQYPLLDEPV